MTGAVYDDRPSMGRKIGIVPDKAVENNNDLGPPVGDQGEHHRNIANFSPKIHAHPEKL